MEVEAREGELYAMTFDCERCTAERCAECVDGSEWREYREDEK